MSATHLNLNGRQVSVDVDQAMPLLWLLRDELALCGTRYGCGRGLCGACTVHIDGVAARSCQMPVGALEGIEVTTIEGARGVVAEAVRRAWKARGVSQCGYCQSGQIMSAIALLTANRSPTRDDIDDALSGNICRCGAYYRIRAAIADAAKELG